MKKDISEDEIRVIGSSGPADDNRKRIWIVAVAAVLVVAAILVAALLLHKQSTQSNQPNESPQTNQPDQPPQPQVNQNWLSNDVDSLPSAVSVIDTLSNGIHLQLLTPYNSIPQLLVGNIDTNDNSVILATMAADIRRDNGKIVGAFVCKGEPLAWGLSKRGYCAIIGDRMAIGTAENSPLFEQATEQQGYFFRHYSCVDEGIAVENNPENKAYRRALCSIDGRIVVIVSLEKVLMNDFSVALANIGVDNAIFLVGGYAQGWYIDQQSEKHSLGLNSLGDNENVNYLVFKRK